MTITELREIPVRDRVTTPSVGQQESAQLAKLLARAGERDSAAFTELYDKTSGRVFGLAFRVISNASLAEEVTQEIYLHIWRDGTAYAASKGSPMAWLLTLAHSRAVDRVRAERALSDREAVYGVRAYGREYDMVAEEVSQRASCRAVRDALRALTELQRESIELAYFGGRTYRQVAAGLGIALPTVKSRIRDGLMQLSRTLLRDGC